MKKYFFHFLLGLIVLIFGYELFSDKEVYFSRYDPEYWEQRYQRSQWAKGWEAEELMGDAELYAYAGWRQIQGDDPTKINPEVPPFGRYLIGFSILVFGNPYIQAPIFGVLFLFVVFFWAKRVLKEKSLALLPVLMFLIEPLFRENLKAWMLDLPFSLFIILAFYFLARGRDNHLFYLPAVVFLAAISATKIYQLGFVLAAIFAFYLFLLLLIYRFKDLFWFLIFLPAFAVFYLGNYAVYFLSGHNLLDFKYLHFWIRHFARVQVEDYPKGEIFRIFFLGRWKTWWDSGEVVRVFAWRPWWVLGFLAIFPAIFQGIFKKNLDLLILCLWPISLLTMFAYGVSYPRYVLPILPALYILLCYNLRLVFLKWRK